MTADDLALKIVEEGKWLARWVPEVEAAAYALKLAQERQHGAATPAEASKRLRELLDAVDDAICDAQDTLSAYETAAGLCDEDGRRFDEAGQ